MSDPKAATRLRILEATSSCVERWGLAKTSLEDVATAAALSRATVYRYFPGGRDQLISETVAWQVSVFLAQLEQAVVDDRGIEAKLVHGLLVGHRAIGEHHLLQQVLSTEREALLTELAGMEPVLFAAVRHTIEEGLEAEPTRPGVARDEASDYLTRLFLSYLGSQGGVDLSDPGAVRRLVRRQFLGGILDRPL